MSAQPWEISWVLKGRWSVNQRLQSISLRALIDSKDPYLHTVANTIETLKNPIEQAKLLLFEVQQLPFVPDPVETGEDLYRAARYTLQQGGDCDDLVSLLMTLSLLKNLVVRPVYLETPKKWETSHMAAEFLIGGHTYWADPSLQTQQLGEHPFAAAKREGVKLE